MGHSRRWAPRLTGLGTAASFVVAALAVGRLWAPAGAHGYRPEATIYPWWTWVLLLAGIGCGAVVALAPAGPTGRRWRLAGAAAALVLGAQVAGTGVVAAKHWRPAQGMGGYPGSTDRLELLALVVAAAGLLVVLLTLGRLVVDGARGRRSPARYVVHLATGLAIIGLLPVVLDHSTLNPPDLTTWGAVGLIYAGPWGAAVCLAGWLARPAALAALGAVVASAVLAAVGPQMQELLFGAEEGLFLVAAVPVALLAAATAGARPTGTLASGFRE